jgi:predicted O-methyltransferase YrrM
MPSKKIEVSPRDSQALRDLIGVVRPAFIVEFGSWEGRSATAFLLEARRLGLQSKIVCVDTWLGSSEHWQNRWPNSEWSFERLKVKNGEPRVLETFWQTIRDHGLTEKVSIVRAPTTFAAPFLKQEGILPELVYLDADHSFVAVLEDLRLARSVVRDGGVIAGDDFSWQSVRLALARFVAGGGDTVLTSKDRSQFVVLDSTHESLREAFQGLGWKVEKHIFLRELPLLFAWRVLRPVRAAIGRFYLAAGIPQLKSRLPGRNP